MDFRRRDVVLVKINIEKNEKTLVVETRQYSKYYILWNVPSEVFN